MMVSSLADERKARQTSVTPQLLYPGVWKLTFGTPEKITPVSVRKSAPAAAVLEGLSAARIPFRPDEIRSRCSDRSFTVFLPHDPSEGIFGLGLQLRSHIQSGKKRQLRVNADPVLDQGDSHAPVPFYLSTLGYGVFIDTARYASIYTGTHAPIPKLAERVLEKHMDRPPTSVAGIYHQQAFGDRVVIDIPAAKGVDVYLFGGGSPLEALRRYILFSGGGCLPPLWALGNWYRAHTGQDAEKIVELARSFRDQKMPFDVMGLEPGWQSHFYPNSFVWSDRFPQPSGFARDLSALGFRINLWENAFVHPEAPFAESIRPYCGDELSTDGLAPDFLTEEACAIFGAHHDEELVAAGASGFKLDECDNSDFLSFAWSFPEYSRFPSGADGEQMHSLYGVHYQHALDRIFEARNLRHYDLVRSSGALAAPLPYVLYSDLYDHADFLRGVVNAGTSGLLWTPEVRHATSVEDLVRRVQSTVLSALSIINAWYIPLPPWIQTDRALNEEGIPMPGFEQARELVRSALELRMRLVPYLYTAFSRYALDGIPPIRPMFLESPDDQQAWACDSQYLLGPSLLVAPVLSGTSSREVFLPEGTWHEFESGRAHAGGRVLRLTDIPLERIPVFVRSGSIVPLAPVLPCIPDGITFSIEARAYGAGAASGELYADDGLTYAYRRESARTWHSLACDASGRLEVSTRGTAAPGRYNFPQHVSRMSGL